MASLSTVSQTSAQNSYSVSYYHRKPEICEYVVYNIVVILMHCIFTEPQDGVKMTLDCAQACFITMDKMVISLKGGEL